MPLTRKRQTVNVADLTAYLEGDLTAVQARELEGRLASCAESRACLEQLRGITQAVARAPHPEPTVDLVARVRQAIDHAEPLPEPQKTWWRRPSWPVMAALAATAAAAVLVLPLGGDSPRPPGAPPAVQGAFEQRGALDDQVAVKAAAPTGDERWVDLQVYRVRAPQPPQRVGGAIRRGDGLLFAYTNLGPRPYAHLLVFGMSEQGRVYWFHPAYERRGSDPRSIAIEPEQAGAELPELIEHDLQPGALTVYAVFSRQPLRVLEVEASIRDLLASGTWDPRAAARLPLFGTAQRVLRLDVR